MTPSTGPADRGMTVRPDCRTVKAGGRKVVVMTRLYEFRLDGQLTDQAREAFCDMRIEEGPAGARLYGEVIDEAHLMGIMAQCRTLGLVIVSAYRISAGAS
jgi:hypothetical protein